MRSRTVASLVAEATRLAEQGVVELTLVSQDSTAYGKDLGDGSNLGTLVRALAKIPKVEWVRVHYLYPHGVPEDLLLAMAEEPKICRYLDIPLQHASGNMLKAMRRGVTREGQERILQRLRQYVPDLAVRTTFIVGFPGETEEDFQVLMDFVQSQRFDRLGVFTYFPEDGTPAATLSGQLTEKIKKERQRKLMNLQKKISREKHKHLVGTVQKVLIDGPSVESEYLLRGRLASQAPDVDGQVYIQSPPVDAKAGQFRMVKILKAAAYDLVGEIQDVPHV
jgi:ribosomal protein S12 methylthiotransferase